MNTYRVIFPARDFPGMDAEDFKANGFDECANGGFVLFQIKGEEKSIVTVIPAGAVIIKVNPIQ